jgi:hypothetical protein
MSSHICKLLFLEKLFIRREVIRPSHACKSSVLQAVTTGWVTYGIIRDSFDFYMSDIYLQISESICIAYCSNKPFGSKVTASRQTVCVSLHCRKSNLTWGLSDAVWEDMKHNTDFRTLLLLLSFLPHFFPFFFISFSFREHLTICCQRSISLVYVYLASYLPSPFPHCFPEIQ